MARRSFVIDEGHLRPDVGPEMRGVSGYGEHLPFYRILEFFSAAWHDFLRRHAEIDDSVILPRVDATFHREVHAGRVDVDVAVLHVGRSSMVLGCTAMQDGLAAASAEVTLVRFDYATRSPIALSDDERSKLLAAARISSNQD